jgi:hypothetical protein
MPVEGEEWKRHRKPPEMTLNCFCDTYLDRDHLKSIEKKVEELHGNKEMVKISYRSGTAVPTARAGKFHGIADLHTSHINTIWEPTDFDRILLSRKHNEQCYRWIVMQQPPVEISQVGGDERPDLRALVISDKVICFHHLHKLSKEIGDSGSVIIGFGKVLQHYCLLPAIMNTARQLKGEAFLLLRNDRPTISSIPTDLFLHHDPELRAYYADKKWIGEHADWSLVVAAPCDRSLSSAPHRPPHVLRTKGPPLALRSSSSTAPLFTRLPQAAMGSPDAHLFRYIAGKEVRADGSVAELGASIRQDAVRVLSTSSSGLQGVGPGEKRARNPPQRKVTPPPTLPP